MSASSSHIVLKRVYDSPDDSDGVRILVDRLWPRGLKKKNAKVDEWLRDLAPSNELRKWFHAHPEQWTDFRRKYLQELRGGETAKAWTRFRELSLAHDPVTLLFASKNADHNNAVVLKEVMDGARKPSHSTHPIAARTRTRRVKR